MAMSHYTGDSYWYAYGYTSRAAAEIALEIAYSAGDVMPGENPRVEQYRTRDGTKAYGIRIN
jgi:hypothetical protein